MQQIMSQIRAAVDSYQLIQAGDRIAVGISGGKDSLVLLCTLANMRKFLPMKYDLVAITVDPCFDNIQTDFRQVEELCRRLQIKYEIRRSQLGNIIFEQRKESNPCSLCARMRRGILHDMSKKHNCNKLALGHHFDDAVQTFFMNLFYGGKIGCFSPMSYLSRKDLYLIRPMVFCEESKVESAAQRYHLPVVKSECPVDGHTKRQYAKDLVRQLNTEHPGARDRMFTAILNGNFEDWPQRILNPRNKKSSVI